MNTRQNFTWRYSCLGQGGVGGLIRGRIPGGLGWGFYPCLYDGRWLRPERHGALSAGEGAVDAGETGPGVSAGERAPRSESRLRPPRPSSASSRLLPPRPTSSSSPAARADHQLPHGALEPRESHIATWLGQLHGGRTEHNQIKATLTFKFNLYQHIVYLWE